MLGSKTVMPQDANKSSIPALPPTTPHVVTLPAGGKSAAVALNGKSPVVYIEPSGAVNYAFGIATVDVSPSDFKWTLSTTLGCIAVPTGATHIRFLGTAGDTIDMTEMG